jgi:hypothetical protein
MFLPSAVVFTAFFGVFEFPRLDPSLVPPFWDGLSFLMEPSQTRLSRLVPITCSDDVVSCSSLPFLRSLHVPSRFPSDTSGQRRRAFIANVRVAVPIRPGSIWCLRHDFMTDFFVLPRCSATAVLSLFVMHQRLRIHVMLGQC